jgi:putative Mg2+ transporter-C (MgtC) family protein
MLSDFVDYIGEINTLSIIIRLSLAVLCGGIIGLERGKKGQAAGFRTHILVCIGSALVMMTNLYVIDVFDASADPTRLGAQVVSGIGFLGAGSIIVTNNNKIKGLTTAAGLWASACMGLAIGVGFYQLAVIGCIFIVVVISVLDRIDRSVFRNSDRMQIYVEFGSSSILREIIDYCKDNEIEIRDTQVIKNKNIEDNLVGAVITIRCNKKQEHVIIITELGLIPGIVNIEEL